MTPAAPEGYPLVELAAAIGGRIHGPSDIRIAGVNSLEDAGAGDLAFLAGNRLLNAAKQSRAAAVVVAAFHKDWRATQLVTPQPHFDFVRLTTRFFTRHAPPTGIAATVAQGDGVRIGAGVSIAAFVSLGHRATIGDRVTIYPGVCVGDDVVIGDDTVLYPHVSILERCRIGARVIIHAGAVIGSDGFGYIQHEGRHHKIPQRGVVVIEDDVELGANVTIDRATFGRTHVKQGSKIDNQVQIAHNVTVGDHGLIVAQVGIAGSTSVGRHVMIGGQAGVIDHVTIGDRAMIAAGAGVGKNVEPGTIVAGRPATQHDAAMRAHVLVGHLPELYRRVAELEKRPAGKRAAGTPRTVTGKAAARKTRRSRTKGT